MTAKADWVVNIGGLRTAYDSEYIICLRGWHIALVCGWLEHLQYKTAQEGEWPLGAEENLEGIRSRMLMGFSLNQIMSALARIESKIDGLEGGASGGCCDMPRDTVVLPPETGNKNPFELPIPEALLDIGVSDYDGLAQYLCDMADWIIDSMLFKVESLRGLYRDGLLILGAIAAVLATVWTGGVAGAVAVAFGTAVAVYDELQGFTDEMFDSAAEMIESLRGTLKCLMKHGAGAGDIGEIVKGILSQGPVGFVVGHLGWEVVIKDVYEASLVGEGYSGVGCVSCDTDTDSFFNGHSLSGVTSGFKVELGRSYQVRLVNIGGGTEHEQHAIHLFKEFNLPAPVDVVIQYERNRPEEPEENSLYYNYWEDYTGYRHMIDWRDDGGRFYLKGCLSWQMVDLRATDSSTVWDTYTYRVVG